MKLKIDSVAFLGLKGEDGLKDKRFCLFIDARNTGSDRRAWCFLAVGEAKRTKLSHELGHCMKGAFYNAYSNFDCRQKHENRADKWAVRDLISADSLDDAVAAGHTEIWDLAEFFGVTEPFMRKAVCYYVHGNLATELYF